MNKVSLTFKITLLFVAFLTFLMLFLYSLFYQMAYDKMLESEKEKVMLIGQTIEPLIAMNYYLNLHDEIVTLATNTAKNPQIAALAIKIENKEIYATPFVQSTEDLHVMYPIRDSIIGEEIGSIDIAFKLENFYQAFEDIKLKIIKNLAYLGIGFFIFGLIVRSFLKPLAQIAKKVQNYSLGSKIDFSNIKLDVETSAIVDSFSSMIEKINEHNVMLERYKHAVDESAIVSKTDLKGIITYVNDEFCKVSGYSSEELVGHNHNIIRHPDMSSNTFKDVWEHLKAKKIWKGVIKNKRKNGTPYYVKSVIVPIIDEDENVIEYIGIRHDVTQIVEQQEQILRQTTDVLTGLPNRVKLDEKIKSSELVKLGLLELDSFYIIEDYFGRETRNNALKEIAELILDVTDGYDVDLYKVETARFAIFGGDNITADTFSHVCMSALKVIRDHTFGQGSDSFNIHANAGVTFLNKNPYSNALNALYFGKDNKKGYVVYEGEDNIAQMHQNNLKWTKTIKQAIDDDRVIVYAQPIYDAKTKVANKYECLVRIVQEDGEVVGPFHFLEIAKKSKMYLKITRKVIAKSFDVFSKLKDKSFSINLSVDDLLNKKNIEFLKENIIKYNVGSQLVLEIVESEGIENFTSITEVIGDLKALGCKISIDDFGTGYSNFAYLMQLNVDYIKIDGSLIKEIDRDKNSQIIAKTLVDFAKQLDMKTVAEYIHNEQVMDYARTIDIDYLQGFHLGIPQPIESLLE